MSTLRVTNLRHESASSSNITLDSSNNAVVAGTLGCTGNLTVTSGNVVLSSGNGIDFSAAAHASGMTSELLDDYEEGTWQCEFGGITGESYSAQQGRYVKIGTLCLASARVQLSNKGTAVGNLSLSLPFAKRNTDDARCTATIQWENMTTSVSNMYGLYHLTQNISLYKSTANTTTSSVVSHADIANNTVIHFSVVYHTA